MKNLFNSTFTTLSNTFITPKNKTKKSLNDLQSTQLSKHHLTSIKGGNGESSDEVEIIITDITGS